MAQSPPRRRTAGGCRAHCPGASITRRFSGNRRWAKNRGLPASFGHKAGFDRLKEITRYAVGDCGIKVLSLYVFSTENFARDAKEVGYLMDLFANNFRTIAEEMNERDCQVLFSGRREGLQQRVLDAMDYMMNLTKDNDKGIVNFCLNYGGRMEILRAAQQFAQDCVDGKCCPEDLTEDAFSARMYSAGVPDPELVIRPGGELRTSNFLLWQSAYAEYYFTDVLWPDFGPKDLEKAIAAYNGRNRRFGGAK